MKLDAEFYQRDTRIVARDLLGCYLVRVLDQGPMAVRICETEAYIGRMDKACHAYQYRRTPRTQTLFSPPGTAYLYLIYGLHHCLNVVTEPEGEPCAVLLRGGEARVGQDFLAQNRFGHCFSRCTPYQKKNFLNGPGKLCQALSLTRAENGLSLMEDTLFLCDRLEDIGAETPSADRRPLTIHCGTRIGIAYAQEAAAFPWRFWYDPQAVE